MWKQNLVSDSVRMLHIWRRVCLLQVHLGGGIWVEEEKWQQLQRTQGDSKFTKNLAVMIWGTETLKNRSVTGVATKKKKDALPKPPLSPSKLKIVRGKRTIFKRFVIRIRLGYISVFFW